MIIIRTTPTNKPERIWEKMNSLNADASIPQILSNKFFMTFPPDSLLSWLILGVFLLVLFYLYLLPKRIHDEAIVKLESKLAIELTEIKNKLDKETELIKIIRSQVEPQKVNTYLAITDLYSDLISPQVVNQTLSSQEMQKEIENKKAFFQLFSRLFFFASDNTIEKKESGSR